MTHLPAVFLAIFWIFADMIGVLLSVISTYFYFGWEGVPLLVPKIFGIAVLAFSSPIAYRFLLRRFDAHSLQRGLLLLVFVMYLALSLYRPSDFFAWGVVATSFVAGLGMMAVLKSLGDMPVWSLPLYTIVVSLFFYLSTRIQLGGLPLLLSSSGKNGFMPWIVLSVFVAAGLFMPHRYPQAVKPDTPVTKGGSLGWVFGLLMGLSVGLVANFNLWSAKTEPLPAAIYFLPASLGALAAWLGYRYGQKFRLPLLAVQTLSLAGGLFVLLYQDYHLLLGLAACFGASFGLYGFWASFLGRWRDYQQNDPDYFPLWHLQGGFIALLLILALFLLKANPTGFWLAVSLSAILLIWHESKLPALDVGHTPINRLWWVTNGMFALMGITAFSLPASHRADPASKDGVIRLMTSNIRYGWSDDYRFEPLEHPRWLKQHLPDLMGLQEVNKGHTSGAYSDNFRLYQRMIPGTWLYGDAHYGFGNALFSKYPILAHETRAYQAKDMLKRSCLISTVQIGNQKVKLFVTHLSHLAPPNPVREAQVTELITWLKESKEPWILMGDFNATPDMNEIQQLLKISDPELQQKDLLKTNSFPAAQPDRRIDYIFFSSQFDLQTMQVLDNGVTSDHRPVYAELKLANTAQNAQLTSGGSRN